MNCQICHKIFDIDKAKKELTFQKGIIVIICPFCKHGNY